ncbi:choice-of-anchor I family protein [Aureivirga sp. CE67]|uniref:choice-of-anchor I family protein n=1 Tax=Aureivirga sp. CE67 TaxID=1788983 RepID=UPI0018C98585|nr:choice-of-anchor I family protein [Aureivirga sp. CE67]
MNKNYLLIIAIFLTAFISQAQTAVITSYMDSPCPSQDGRVVEIYVNGTVDFAGWNLQRQSNGDGYNSNINLSNLGTITDAFAYITNDAATITSEFGISTNVLENGNISSNGDDAFQIVDNNDTVIDRFGEDGVDGTGTAWEHVDTYYKRNNNVAPNYGNFDVTNWTFGELGLLVGTGLCNGGEAYSNTFSLATYSYTPPVSATLSVSAPTADQVFDPSTSSIEISFNTENFTFSTDENTEDGDGYLVYSSNGFSNNINHFSTDAILLTELTPGTYTYSLKLVNNEGETIDGTEMTISFSIDTVTEVASLTALRADFDANGAGTYYEITGQVVVSNTNGYQGRKWVQDTEGTISGILIKDTSDAIETTFNTGDIFTNIKGYTVEENGVLKLIPFDDDAITLVSSDNEITVQTISVEEFTTNGNDYESELIKIEGINFEDADGTAVYTNGTNYTVTDGTNTTTLRTDFYDMDYIGEVIPSLDVNVIGIAAEYNGNYQFTPRNNEDIEVISTNVSFEETVISISEADASVVVKLILEEATTAQSTVDVSLYLSNNDAFAFTTQTITFEEGESEKEFSIEIPQNTEKNIDYFVALQLENTSNVELGEETMTTIYVSDDEMHIEEDAPDTLGMTFQTSFGELGGAEILAHDPVTEKLFVTNSEDNTLQVLDFSDPSNITYDSTVSLNEFGASVTSVTVYENLVAVSVKSEDYSNGKVVFLNTNGEVLANVEVGVLPDMLTFTPNGTSIIVANEGEPNDDYTVDPEGSISIITLPENIAEITTSDVTTLDFNAFDSQLEDLQANDVRIFGLNATVSQDLEPEYITISEDSSTAWVVLQENNAYATVDLTSNTITSIKSFGYKDFSLEKNAFDASNDIDFIFMSTWNVKGMYQPDGIANFEKDGVKYIVTANEGDGRDYDGYSEENRVKDLNLDETAFPNADFIQEKRNLGRLKITTSLGDTDNDGDYDELYAYGARSFSIFNAETGELVYDSADMMERIIKEHEVFGEMFNTTNSDDKFKNRSDDKGPEPEGVIVKEIDEKFYAFVGLERVGGIMVFDITNPTAPVFETYVNNRTFDEVENDDLGPEGLIYVDPNDNGLEKGLIVVANEVSATVSVYSLENVDATIGIEDFSKNETITLYPNPSNNSFVFLSKPSSFEVFDTLGRKVLEGKNASKINTKSLTKGTYIVKFEKGTSTKLVVN